MVDKWQWWMAGACMALVVGVARADSLEAQRDRYQQIKQAWDSNQMDRVQQLMPALRDYPLYPYLEYRMLSQNLQNETRAAVQQFIQHYPTLPPARTLETRFINELARRQDWQGLLSFSPQEPKPVAARCNWNYAMWATGQQQVAWRGAKDIWLRGTSLPAVCDDLFRVWQNAGQQSPDTTLERIRLAMKAGNGSLVNYLARLLPDNYKTTADAIMALQNDPATVENFAASAGPTDFTRQMTGFAFSRMARQDAEYARAMIPTLARLQKMDDGDIQQLKETVAWRLMATDVTSEQARWRDGVVMDSESVSLIERRIRLALADNDRRGLNTWLARLPVEAKEKDEWQYWQADLLLTQGRKEEALAILRKLMQGRGFYPMVAARRLEVTYPLRIDQAPPTSDEVSQGTALARVRELMYWGMDNLARSEWSALVASKPALQQQQLASYALKQGWWDLSVQATITGKLWNNLTERFPLAWRDEFSRYTRDKSIPQSYAMAIARQESAWNPKARSPVGASGLMQLMPATAAHTVKMFSITDYLNSSQLFDPQTNIEIGTQYLDYVYRQFGNNRIFSSAAYNAGPGRVRNWLNASAGRLDPVAFIETVPFAETRLYVKNVLAYDAYYRHFMKQSDDLFTAEEWQRHY
ncbi:murein transglycosylase [Erwinia sp. OLTSP20]|uniref:murein transglycosylase n=1 Tax=unclassified Erwinia TaxID=2622719 RepID=UPI000C19865D|nr:MULTISPECIES: murein transglycosylase [unclassified Erwinia]PIJ50272.1 murein transglycosylase [Erwinia sp. OAMSP11]PIJ72110.1 murein transglycosylase [Erwinia sp. OLSSP12]PIJ81401.1 murein transglycosylase [Erwinia sp. OLCASP19]PIJ84107.1 murein transglycosylase [Erwinia sp. OLMTSP26]PIJ85806.1 murein transglycosylase [Erwinia sp. OLMDSP33]